MFIDLELNLSPIDEPDVGRSQRRPTHESAPSGKGRLADWPSSRIVVVCTTCGRREVYAKDSLLAASPRDVMLPTVLSSLISSCENQRVAYLRDRCRARLVAE